MSTHLVTGGLGFVGRHLVAGLVAEGHAVVSYNRDFATSDDPAVTVVQGELFDLPRLLRALAEHRVDGIFHTAAMSHPELSLELPVTTIAANVDGTVHVFEAARLAGVGRIVNFSSECAYGPQSDGPVREDAPLAPTTPYGVTKVATELLGAVYTRRYGVEVVSLRPTEIYGPGNPMPEVLRELVAAGARGDAFALEEGGDHRFQFVHVEDVARAALLAMAAAPDALSQPVYNVAAGEQHSLFEAAALVRERFPEAEIELGGGHVATLDRQARFDLGAAERDLGYVPGWGLEAGIDHYAAWLAEHRF